MKQIINWRKATVADIEADGLLDVATKLHVLAYKLDGKGVSAFHGTEQANRIKDFYQYHIDNKIPIVGHNFITFDVPLTEKILGIDLSELLVIDTLAVSWYLNLNRVRHGLDFFFEDYGIKKPEIKDWDNLSYEEYKNRCVEDVKINTALWEDLRDRLVSMYTISSEMISNGEVGGSRVSATEEIYIDSLKGLSVDEHITRVLSFLMHKMECVALQEKTRWEVDVDYLLNTEKELAKLVETAKVELEGVMPQIPKYVARKEPAKPFKKNGELSAAGEKWKELKEILRSKAVDEQGNLLCKVVEQGKIHELTSYDPPNIGSHQQVKDFLFSKGWEPASFKSVRDKDAFEAWIRSKPEEGSRRGAWTEWKNNKPVDREIPQINVDGEDGKELCGSVLELSEKVPEVKALESYSVIFHRLSMIRGFLKNLQDEKYLLASVGGFTNTLRMQHRILVNLPATNKPFAQAIRGCLISGKGKISLGSDLSGLEDRVKHHFMIPHDPEYVATMMEDDYDAHIYMAYGSGLISEKQYLDFKEGIRPSEVVEARRKGKTLNYSCLPTDNTEVLTDKGWKKFSEISLGDRVMSLNNQSGNTEFCKVLGEVFYEDREVLSIQVGQNWKVESTPDHRWVVDRYTGRGGTKRKVREYITTEKLNSSCNLITSAPYVGGESKVTPDEAALLGWVLSDGYLSCSKIVSSASQGRNGERQAVQMSVSQSKYVEELEGILNKVGLKYSTLVREDGLKFYTISSPEARKFIKKIGLPISSKHEIDYTKFILSLSQDSLEAFLNAFWMGDGQTVGLGSTYRTKIVYQNGGNILDAIQLGYELLGKSCIMNESTVMDNFYTLRARNRGHITLQKAIKEYSRNTDVFCLTTENGNFVIRQNGIITITGNCVYGAGGAKVASTLGVSAEEGKDLVEGYWKVNWAVEAIAKEQVVIECSKGYKWLINPINGFLYNIRSEKDIFSTLAQGTGAFFFDMWVDKILNKMVDKWGVKSLTYQAHDELVIVCKDNERIRETLSDMVKQSIEEVNKEFLLRRPLGCDVQFGKRYSEIH